MRIDLGKLSLADTVVDLAREGHPRDQVIVRDLEGGIGTFIQSAAGIELKGVAAEKVLLDVLLMSFGTFTLHAQGSTIFQRLTAELATLHGALNGRVDSTVTSSHRLSITVGKLRITGQLDAEHLVLDLKGDSGEVRADKALFRSLEVQSGDLRIECPVLNVEQLSIGWGDDPSFRLRCGKALAAELGLASAGMKVKAREIELSGVDVRGPEVAAASVKLASVEADVTFVRSNKKAIEPALEKEAAGKLPLYDDRLLDGLSGRIKADVEVDVAVPIIGGRRAVHELRLPVQAGSIDYLKLEGGLSRLEDALLNFAVRDGKLVLELGFPVLGPRGHGKPLLVWELTPDDYELAQNNRVRLAVLPQARPANGKTTEEPSAEPSSEPAEEGGSSRFRLRSLSVGKIDTELALDPFFAPAPEGALRPPVPLHASLQELAFEKIRVQGTVHHDLDARDLANEDEDKQPNRKGELRVTAEQIALKLREFALAENELTGALQLGHAEDIVLSFEDTHLAQISGVLNRLALQGVKFGAAS